MSSLQGKGNFQKPNLCFGGLGNFPQKIFSQTDYLYINKSLIGPYKEICCSFFEALSILWKFSTIHDSTQPNRKTFITTELFSFLSVEKNHSPFSLNFVYGPQSSHRDQWLSLQTLKKSIRVKPSRPLVCLSFGPKISQSVSGNTEID